MNIIELLQREVQLKYKPDWQKPITDESYTLHCSEAVYEAILEVFNGLRAITVKDSEEIVFTRFMKFKIPHIGLLNVKIDMEEGYRTEKDDKENSN